MKRKIIIFSALIIFSFLFLNLCEFALAQTNHFYINGKVINFTPNTVKIDTAKEVLYFSNNMRIVKHIKKGKSIYEEPATLKELRINDSVTVKVIGNIVHELIIEVYKR